MGERSADFLGDPTVVKKARFSKILPNFFEKKPDFRVYYSRIARSAAKNVIRPCHNSHWSTIEAPGHRKFRFNKSVTTKQGTGLFRRSEHLPSRAQIEVVNGEMLSIRGWGFNDLRTFGFDVGDGNDDGLWLSSMEDCGDEHLHNSAQPCAKFCSLDFPSILSSHNSAQSCAKFFTVRQHAGSSMIPYRTALPLLTNYILSIAKTFCVLERSPRDFSSPVMQRHAGFRSTPYLLFGVWWCSSEVSAIWLFFDIVSVFDRDIFVIARWNTY